MAGFYGYLGRLLIPPFAVRNNRVLHFWLAALPTIGIWLATAGVCLMAFNLNGFNFNHSILDSQGHIIRTDADLLNRANIGIQVMESLNTHHFPLILAGGDAVPVS